MESVNLCYCWLFHSGEVAAGGAGGGGFTARHSGDPEPNSGCWNCRQAAYATGRWWSVVISAVVFMSVSTWIIAGKSASELDYIRLFAFYVWLILGY